MKDKLLKDIEKIKANLEVLPEGLKRRNYVKKETEIYSELQNKLVAELVSRCENIEDKNNISPQIPYVEKLDPALIKYASKNCETIEKMDLSNYFYQLTHRSELNLGSVNEIIKKIMYSFKENSIILKEKDFNYTECVSKYMNAFLNDYDNIDKVFDSLYWEYPNLIDQIVLAFKHLYFENLRKINREIDKKYKKFDIKSYLNNYLRHCKEKRDVYHKFKKNIYDKLLSNEINIKNYSENDMQKVFERVLINQEVSCEYNEIYGLYEVLNEYKDYMFYEEIIITMKDLYSSKKEYKGLYSKKLKEISKKEKEQISVNKKIIKLQTKLEANDPKLGALKIKRVTLIDEIINLYKELDDLRIKEYIYQNVSDNTNYVDLLKLATYDFNFFVNFLSKKDNELTHDKIQNKISELFKFIYEYENDITSNSLISEDKNIAQNIIDRYSLTNINITPEDLSEEGIDSYLELVNTIVIYYNMTYLGINLFEIEFVLNCIKEGIYK